MGYYLMIKRVRHNDFKYLCKSADNKDHIKYKGSGVYWRKVLKQHPDWIIDTEVLGHYDTNEELKKAGIYYSRKYDIVKRKDWANCMIEQGDGGSTTKGKVYIYHPTTLQEKVVASLEDMPDGWQAGRVPFERPKEASEKSAAWHRGRKRSEQTRQNMRNAERGKRRTIQCEYCDREITPQNIKRHIEKTHGNILFNKNIRNR